MEITRHRNGRKTYFEVNGQICNDVESLTFEPYSRVFRTRADAEADKAKWERLTERSMRDHAEIKARYAEIAAERQAARDAKAAERARQLSLF